MLKKRKEPACPICDRPYPGWGTYLGQLLRPNIGTTVEATLIPPAATQRVAAQMWILVQERVLFEEAITLFHENIKPPRSIKAQDYPQDYYRDYLIDYAQRGCFLIRGAK